jgi:hypothetical protein
LHALEVEAPLGLDQAKPGRDDVDRAGAEAASIGELAAKVERAQEGKGLADRQTRLAQALGKSEAGARRAQEPPANPVEARGREQKRGRGLYRTSSTRPKIMNERGDEP